MPPTGRRPQKDARAPKPPLRFGEDPLIWASWLYYEEGLTQGEIAEVMGTSRPTVNAYLADARARGIVNISIAYDKLRAAALSVALAERFGLDDCLIIPGEGGTRSLIDRLGAAGAQALPRLVHSGDTIAITWGRTMLALAAASDPLNLLDLTVVQATGSTTAAIPYTPEACATRLADSIGARFVPLSAPAVVSSPAARRTLMGERVIAEQFHTLGKTDCAIFGVSSLRPDSTVHSSGFFDDPLHRDGQYAAAVGSLAGRFIDASGAPLSGPLEERIIGIALDDLRRVRTRMLVAGGYDKIPAILASLRGGYVSVLVTDSATGEGLLRTDGVELGALAPLPRETSAPDAVLRSRLKKFVNDARDSVDEALEGALAAFPRHIEPIAASPRAIRATERAPEGKVGIVIGGGAGHDPAFLGFVGRGLADAVAVGNIFASPPPDRILACARAADRGAGVMFIYGNYTGDVMNFDMAAELAEAEGLRCLSLRTTDDIASADPGDRLARRGTAGNVFVFKIAGAATARMYPLDECLRIARKANDACRTIGVALEPGSNPYTLNASFQLREGEMEFGVGVHGEPGVTRRAFTTADRIVDQICDRLFSEMVLDRGKRIAVLVNSLGASSMMELFILNRRLAQRLKTREVEVVRTYVGHYFTSLDMAGASITIIELDAELAGLLDDPCDGFALHAGPG